MKKLPIFTVATLAITGCTTGSHTVQTTETAKTNNNLTLICENFRREYSVTYEGGPIPSVYASSEEGDTYYKVLAVEETKDRHVITGLTLNDGPTYRLHFRPYKKMEYFVDNQLFQTDGCR